MGRVPRGHPLGHPDRDHDSARRHLVVRQDGPEVVAVGARPTAAV